LPCLKMKHVSTISLKSSKAQFTNFKGEKVLLNIR
jgi:hypothetical protein